MVHVRLQGKQCSKAGRGAEGRKPGDEEDRQSNYA